VDRKTEQAIDTYNRLMRHYLTLLLERAGVGVHGDVAAELEAMGDALKTALAGVAGEDVSGLPVDTTNTTRPRWRTWLIDESQRKGEGDDDGT